MDGKKTTVTLTNGAGCTAFGVEHAERLLNWHGSGWSLADEGWTFKGGSLERVAAAKKTKGK